MLVSHPFRDIDGNYDYFFVNRFGKLSCIKSEKKLEVGSLMFLEAFPAGDYLLRVTEMTQEEGKTIIEWESADATICMQQIPEGD